MSIFEITEEVLKQIPKYCSSDGKLLRNTVLENAEKMDKDLLSVLIKNDATKKAYFTEVDGIQVFDKVKFSWIIQNKEFLPDSYTRYKNKIGLTNSRGEFISASNDVELVFPYKDCILEGGQTKEDQKNNEIFYNETLAPDQVSNLLAPKAFCNAKKYDKDGVHEITEITDEDNLIIKGNNLLALSSLKNKYSNKIKMAYWDIPYNTGSDSFGYNDNFSRSTWLCFIKNRIQEVYPLLSNDNGVILLQCSFHQYSYLKVLLDEILGTYILTFNVLVRHPDRTLAGDKNFNDVIEYVLVYSKNKSFKMPKIIENKTVDEYEWEIKEKSDGKKIEFDGRKGTIFLPSEYELIKGISSKEKFKIITVRGSIKEKVSSGRFYMKYLNPIQNEYPAQTLFKVDGIGDDMYSYRYFYLPPTGNKNGAYLQGMPISTNVTYKPYPNYLEFVQSYNTVNAEGTVEFRNGKKPEDLIAFFVRLFTNENDFILDSFGGSGTTASVALKMNRRFLLIEQMDYIYDITVKRIHDAIMGKENDILVEYSYNGGGSFVYCELAKLNQNFVDKIQSCKTDEEIKIVTEEILKSDFVSSRVKPSDINTSAKEYSDLTFEEKQQLAMALLDKNQLYVNNSERKDPDMKLSENDIKFTESFYNNLH